MIDAFKPEYLKYASYLSSLTKKYQGGTLEMPPGHWGGVETIFKGKSDIVALFYRKKNSSLRWVKYFSWLNAFGNFGRIIIDSVINIIRFLKGRELFRTGNIPLNKLHNFEIAIEKPLYKIDGVEFYYFGKLDYLGHRYGTKSEQIIKAVKRIDKKISKIDFDILFSDHGMVDITKTISVPISDKCFIDSDMARYWGEKEQLEKIKEKLPLSYGKIINWRDKKYGNLIFMAETGILIWPNFWKENNPDKAMHGYDGKHKEMKAFYIIKKDGKKTNIKAGQLHKILIQMLKDGR